MRFNEALGATLQWDNRAWIRVQTKFNDEFVEAMKELIPVRAWDKANKVWVVPVSYKSILETLVQKHFKEKYVPLSPIPDRSQWAMDQVSDPAKAAPTRVIPANIALAPRPCHVTLGVLPTAPMIVVNAAFAALQAEHGLTPDRLRQLADAYRTIKQEHEKEG